MPAGEDETGACIDNIIYTDDYGDGCEWYNDWPEDCGGYDDMVCGSSNEACCACLGGEAGEEPEETAD